MNNEQDKSRTTKNIFYWIVLILGIFIVGFMIIVAIPAMRATGDANLVVVAGPPLIGLLLIWFGVRGIKGNLKK